MELALLKGIRTVAQIDLHMLQQHRQIRDLPLHLVFRYEIALPLQQMLRLYTVGSFLRAWDDLSSQRTIEQLFDDPDQARHAAATCAAWVGWSNAAAPSPTIGWWRDDVFPDTSASAKIE